MYNTSAISMVVGVRSDGDQTLPRRAMGGKWWRRPHHTEEDTDTTGDGWARQGQRPAASQRHGNTHNKYVTQMLTDV